MSEKETSKKQGLFEKLYSLTEEGLKAIAKPTVKRAVKRKLESVYDDATNKIIEAEQKLLELRKNFSDYDANAILETRAEVETLNKLQEQIKEEHELLFDEPLRVSE